MALDDSFLTQYGVNPENEISSESDSHSDNENVVMPLPDSDASNCESTWESTNSVLESESVRKNENNVTPLPAINKSNTESIGESADAD